MKMRVLLAISFLLNSQSISGEKNVAINVPCNKELDGLLAADPDGNENAFMSCQGVGVGTIGFWERKVCPNNMVFDFINQMCKARGKKSRKQQTLNIAILNNSCANGETCIGGSTCDSDSLKCMCPYGTVPQLDTLSCETAEMSFVSPPVENSRFSFNAFSGLEKSPMNGGFSTNNFNGPPPNTFQPNPVFKFSNNRVNNNFGLGNNQNNNNNNNNNNNFNWNPDFNFKPNWNNGVFTGSNNNDQSNYGNPFQPNPVQKFIYNVNNPNPAQSSSSNNNNNNQNNNFGQSATTPKKVTTLARPGDSCRANELCVGGSICTLPIGLCLCPGDLEERDGECVLPAAAALKIIKVGIGALCSDLAECDNGSTCVMGRCACLSPLVQHEGKCVLRQQQKHVGPGELCDNGEICSKGSVCDAVIPVCVCPSDTDLNDGECQRIQSSHQTSAVETTTQPIYRPPPQPVFTVPPPSQPEPSPRTFPQPQPTYTYNQYTTRQPLPPTIYQTTPAPRPVFVATNPPTAPPAAINYKSIFTVPPKPVQTQKPNHMKISLGGSKQAGVGVRCALNTDCMIGAYCNGNTNPPSCQCLSTHVNIEGRCEKVVYPGQVGCRSDLQCTSAYTGTSCIDRICVCPEGKKAVDQTCVPANEPVTSPPGGSCSGARECTGGAVCKEGWCICPDSSMIVHKGICVQSGPKPTLPPKHSMIDTPQPSVPVYQTATTLNLAPTYRATQMPPVATYQPSKASLPTTQGRKTVPGSQCGPLDTCVGGSQCIDGLCVCPAGLQPTHNGRCEASRAPATKPYTTGQGSASTRGPYSSAAEVLSRRPPAFIELPTHAPLTTTAAVVVDVVVAPSTTHTPNTQDECAAIGLICKGNTVCRNRSCQCPDGFVLHHDGCISPNEAARRKVRGKARHQVSSVTGSVFSRPGGDCTAAQICTGGSRCNGQLCQCPPEKAEIRNDECSAPLTRIEAGPGESCDDRKTCSRGSTCVSGQCRCQPGYIAVSGNCIALPLPTTPKSAVYAKPLESCDNGEICEGGASCDEDTGICMCPPGQIVFGVQCMPPPTQTQTFPTTTTTRQQATITSRQTLPPSIYSTDCESDANCGENKICVVGRCKCKPGFVDNSGVCEPLEDIDVGERPVPVSYAKHKVETLRSERLPASEEEELPPTAPTTTTVTSTMPPIPPTTRAPSRQETQRPRVVGPPIRRPRPKPKSGGSGGGSSGALTGNRGTGNYKSGGTGSGNCPPGNDPTRDDSGHLITCNGLEPNCPPRSYCYITSGGFATEEYNCCKSW